MNMDISIKKEKNKKKKTRKSKISEMIKLTMCIC